jgi:glycosyltransferase involved in cell wall biosynthesis
MTVTVVIPARGRPDLLLRALAALDSQAQDAGVSLPVVVVDDASPEPLAPSVDPVRLRHLELDLARQVPNRGPGAARNRGLANVTTSWVAFLDSDMVPGSGWLRRVMCVSQEPDAPDGVEGRVEVPLDRPPTPFMHATEFTVAGSHHGAGNIAYRVDVLRHHGGFDERFFDPRRGLHFREDTDLYFRVRDGGGVLRHDEGLVALHPPLESSWLVPIHLARRYYFDPLLAREHPRAFRELAGTRRIGPVSLRRARHEAARCFAAGCGLTVLGAALRRRPIWAVGAVLAGASWAANLAALSWGRRVRLIDVPAIAGVSLATPLVYLWNHERGVRRFGCRPRY